MVSEEVYTCVICPMACSIKAKHDNGKILEISGNSCPRGKAFVEQEITLPKRMVMTTVRIRNGTIPQLPVRTKEPIPKNKILDAVREIRKVVVDAPIKMGDIILENVAGTNVAVIAERDVGRE
ncbi:MAG: DUF1667 domain-containing protein [Candidatus Korarchaeota archaeon]